MALRKYDDVTLNKLHKVQLEILDEFVRVCQKNNLTYFLVGGTLLGAIRHSGFIPWDDDIDIGMPRKDYDKFLEICNKELDKKYFLDCFDTNNEHYFPFAKIRKDGTIFDEEWSHHLDNNKGIFIDIFPFENISNPKSPWFKIRAIIISSITDVLLYKAKIKKVKETHHPLVVSVFNLFSKPINIKIQKYLICCCKDDNSKYISVLAGGYGYRREMNLRENVLPAKPIVFENKEYMGMNNNDIYLTNLYGDYMKLPPKEKRYNHMPLNIKFGDLDEEE